MSPSASIGANLPYLRRFARALTGNQASGDAYAIATLEAIAEDPSAVSGSLEPRQSLYQVFLKIWGSLAVNHRCHDQTENATMRAADRTLEALTPLPRVVFLLRALEGFTTSEIADVLRRSQADIQNLLDVAGREIASQLRTDVLI